MEGASKVKSTVRMEAAQTPRRFLNEVVPRRRTLPSQMGPMATRDQPKKASRVMEELVANGWTRGKSEALMVPGGDRCAEISCP